MTTDEELKQIATEELGKYNVKTRPEEIEVVQNNPEKVTVIVQTPNLVIIGTRVNELHEWNDTNLRIDEMHSRLQTHGRDGRLVKRIENDEKESYNYADIFHYFKNKFRDEENPFFLRIGEPGDYERVTGIEIVDVETEYLENSKAVHLKTGEP